MKFNIINESKMTFTGYEKEFSTINGENFTEIPKFWQQVMNDGTFSLLLPETDELGVVGLCYGFNTETSSFKYMIGVRRAHLEIEHTVSKVFEEQTFAVFEAKGALPDSLQGVIKNVYSEWLPNSNYVHDGDPEIEVYPGSDAKPEDYICYYWLPVKEKLKG